MYLFLLGIYLRVGVFIMGVYIYVYIYMHMLNFGRYLEKHVLKWFYQFILPLARLKVLLAPHPSNTWNHQSLPF